MTKQEVVAYEAAQEAAYLGRYDALAKTLLKLAASDDYSEEVTRLLEDLAEVCQTHDTYVKQKAAWHKAMSAIVRDDRM